MLYTTPLSQKYQVHQVVRFTNKLQLQIYNLFTAMMNDYHKQQTRTAPTSCSIVIVLLPTTCAMLIHSLEYSTTRIYERYSQNIERHSNCAKSKGVCSVEPVYFNLVLASSVEP
jgi:hypothetical protein